MFAGDLAFLFQPLQILPDRGFTDLEGHGKLSHPGTAFFLNPIQNAASPGFGEKARDRFLTGGFGFRFQVGPSPK